jgi:hypothetical protein
MRFLNVTICNDDWILLKLLIKSNACECCKKQNDPLLFATLWSSSKDHFAGFVLALICFNLRHNAARLMPRISAVLDLFPPAA